jgi:hypothetical protein
MTDDFDKLFQSFEEPKAQTKEPAKKPFTPYKKPFNRVGGVSDQDRQASIERQNALTNAANLFKADCESLVNDKDFSSAITSAIKKVAKELLNFHKEV